MPPKSESKKKVSESICMFFAGALKTPYVVICGSTESNPQELLKEMQKLYGKYVHGKYFNVHEDHTKVLEKIKVKFEEFINVPESNLYSFTKRSNAEKDIKEITGITRAHTLGDSPTKNSKSKKDDDEDGDDGDDEEVEPKKTIKSSKSKKVESDAEDAVEKSDDEAEDAAEKSDAEDDAEKSDAESEVESEVEPEPVKTKGKQTKSKKVETDDEEPKTKTKQTKGKKEVVQEPSEVDEPVKKATKSKVKAK